MLVTTRWLDNNIIVLVDIRYLTNTEYNNHFNGQRQVSTTKAINICTGAPTTGNGGVGDGGSG